MAEETVKRYEYTNVARPGSYEQHYDLRPAEDGEWVSYEDHQRIVDRLTRELAERTTEAQTNLDALTAAVAKVAERDATIAAQAAKIQRYVVGAGCYDRDETLTALRATIAAQAERIAGWVAYFGEDIEPKDAWSVAIAEGARRQRDEDAQAIVDEALKYAAAYDGSIFPAPPLSKAPDHFADPHTSVDRYSAAMGRHMAQAMVEFAAELRDRPLAESAPAASASGGAEPAAYPPREGGKGGERG